jgi:hypothetical protein
MMILSVCRYGKTQSYFVGGRRDFGFDVVSDEKAPSEVEQTLMVKMKKNVRQALAC